MHVAEAVQAVREDNIGVSVGNMLATQTVPRPVIARLESPLLHTVLGGGADVKTVARVVEVNWKTVGREQWGGVRAAVSEGLRHLGAWMKPVW